MQRRSLRISLPPLLFIAAWLSVLCVPLPRLMLQVQLGGNSELSEGILKGPTLSGSWTSLHQLASELEERYPNNLAVQVVAADDYAEKMGTAAVARSNQPAHLQKTICARLDKLMQRYPSEPWLIAKRLGLTLHWMQPNRVGGELSDAKYRPGVISPERLSTPPNFTLHELEEVITLARRGQRLEPSNAFFDNVLTRLLMWSFRDTEALQTLRRGSVKPYYNDYSRHDAMAKITVKELARRRGLLWEEKALRFSYISLTLGARQRELARLITWQGIKAERQGDHQRALQIYSSWILLTGLMRRNSYSSTDALVAAGCQAVALSASSRKLSPAERMRIKDAPRGTNMRLLAQKFHRYASRHGRPDLGREAQRAAEISADYMAAAHVASTSGNRFFGMRTRPLISSVVLWWASVNLLWQSLLCGLFWLVVTAFIRLLRIPSPSPSLHRRDVVGLVCFGCGVAVTMLIATLWWGFQWCYPWPFGSLDDLKTAAAYADIREGIYLASIVAPLVIATDLIALVTWWRQWQSAKQEPELLHLEKRERGHDFLLTMGALFTWGACGCLLTVWISALIFPGKMLNLSPLLTPPPIPPISIDLETIVPVWLLMGFMLILSLEVARWAVLTPAHRKPFISYRLHWLQQTLGFICVLCSVSYAAVSLVAIPQRQQADAEVNALVVRGEAALIRASQRNSSQ